MYLGANIDKINARAFANCVVLENVYTAQNVNAEYAVLSDANFAKNSFRNPKPKSCTMRR